MYSNEAVIEDEEEGFLRRWFKWCPTSMTALRLAEKRVLSCLKRPYKGRYVGIGLDQNGNENKVWSVTLNEDNSNTPIVLLHGFGAGVGLWCMNLDDLSQNRPVYAFDLLGFGRSSRPSFSNDPIEAENQFVNSIEEWRKKVKLDKFVMLGHSLGGYLAASYALQHPKHIKHLVLADPWGFPEKPDDLSTRYQIPFWVKAIGTILQPLNPLWGVRAAGPIGPKLISMFRPDLIEKYGACFYEDKNVISDYIYHCNAQTPSGESAFHSMMFSFGWSKQPMINRFINLSSSVPVTFLFGSKSWVDNSTGYLLQKKLTDSYIDVKIVKGAGHHIYADRKEDFCEVVNTICNMTDKWLGGEPLPKVIPLAGNPKKREDFWKSFVNPQLEENIEEGIQLGEDIPRNDRQ